MTSRWRFDQRIFVVAAAAACRVGLDDLARLMIFSVLNFYDCFDAAKVSERDSGGQGLFFSKKGKPASAAVQAAENQTFKQEKQSEKQATAHPKTSPTRPKNYLYWSLR